MENAPSDGVTAMSDFDPNEKERLENWRALQISLGLVPDESPVPVTPTAKPAAEKAAAAPPPAAAQREADIQTFAAEMLGPSPAEAPAGETAEVEQEVEVGEAPEEVPDEPGEEAPGGEKRRRRRRRRRRRGGEAEGEARPAAESNGEPAAAGAAPAVELPEVEEDAEGSEAGDEEDEDEIEPISIPDWNVPIWQELIDSLYRPER